MTAPGHGQSRLRCKTQGDVESGWLDRRPPWTCTECGQQSKNAFLSFRDHVSTKHMRRRPSLRCYHLASPKALGSYLRFLQRELPDISRHVHFSELKAMAAQPDLNWRRDGGQSYEKIVHLTADAHVSPCTSEQCSLTNISVDYSGNVYGYSRSYCDECKKADRAAYRARMVPSTSTHEMIVIWTYPNKRSWAPANGKYSSSVSAKSIYLLLRANSGRRCDIGWNVPFVRKCPDCNRPRIPRTEYLAGPAAARDLVSMGFCACGFTCMTDQLL